MSEKYTRTDSSPFAPLHNYIYHLSPLITWLVILIANSFPSSIRFSFRLMAERFSVLSFNLASYWKLPRWKTWWLNHDIEYHLLAVSIHFSSSNSPRTRSRKWKNKSTWELFADRNKDIVLGYTLMASHLRLLPCRILIADDWISKNHIDEIISTSISRGPIGFP